MTKRSEKHSTPEPEAAPARSGPLLEKSEASRAPRSKAAIDREAARAAAPRFICRRVHLGGGEWRFRFECPFCRRTHTHGAAEGLRAPHCHDSNSPYNDSGYWLLAPERTED